jgi:acyl carrier protein phosphodiesterase
MNFLAHAYLSFNNPDILAGNMMADAVRGKQADGFPDEIRKGILLHRAIDGFTDEHVLVKQTRKIFYPTISHYALVISDVIYDHFLGVHWARYSKKKLSDFATQSYADLDKYTEWMPEKFARIFPFMKEYNWFELYASKEGIHETIERLGHRSKSFIWANETIVLLEENYTELENHFLAFFPLLVDHSREFLTQLK